MSFCFGVGFFLYEIVNGLKVKISGQDLFIDESSKGFVLMSNHPTEIDWLFMWAVGVRFGWAKQIVISLKKELLTLPLIGWLCHLSDFIFFSRKWEVDQHQLKHSFNMFLEEKFPLVFCIFPEGTDYSHEKRIYRNKQLKENGVNPLSHVLEPRSKGFQWIVENSGYKFDWVYDMTIVYTDKNDNILITEKERPNMLTLCGGVCPANVNIHLRKINISSLIKNNNGQIPSDWMHDRFVEKDGLIQKFHEDGCFPDYHKERSYKAKSRTLSPLIGSFVVYVFSLIGLFWGYHNHFLATFVYIGVSFFLLALVTGVPIINHSCGHSPHPSKK